MSRKLVVYTEVKCDLCHTDLTEDTAPIEWVWDGIDYEIDVCKADLEKINEGKVPFGKMLAVSREKMFKCTKCERSFKTERGRNKHTTDAHRGA